MKNKNEEKPRIVDLSDLQQGKSSKKPSPNQSEAEADSLLNQFRNEHGSDTAYDEIRVLMNECQKQLPDFEKHKKFIDDQKVDAKVELAYWKRLHADLPKPRKNTLKQNKTAYEVIELDDNALLAEHSKLVRLLRKTDIIPYHYKHTIVTINGKRCKYDYTQMPKTWMQQAHRNIPNSLRERINKKLSKSYSNETINKVLRAMYDKLPAITKWFYNLQPIQQFFVKYCIPFCFLLVVVSAIVNKTETNYIDRGVVSLGSIAGVEISDILSARIDQAIEFHNNGTSPKIYSDRKKRIKYWLLYEKKIDTSITEQELLRLVDEGHWKKFEKMYVK